MFLEILFSQILLYTYLDIVALEKFSNIMALVYMPLSCMVLTYMKGGLFGRKGIVWEREKKEGAELEGL